MDFEVARMYRFKKGSGLPLRVPVVDLIEIGAGGGSIVRIDDLGLVKVGPDSVGADPGPACYGRGGDARDGHRRRPRSRLSRCRIRSSVAACSSTSARHARRSKRTSPSRSAFP